jgi:hypothetical protein
MVPKYPALSTLTFLVGWAFEKGIRPSKVYRQFLAHPRDFQVLSSYAIYADELQELEQKKAEEEAKQSKYPKQRR